MISDYSIFFFYFVFIIKYNIVFLRMINSKVIITIINEKEKRREEEKEKEKDRKNGWREILNL